MKKIAVFPGTFDPVTNGHLNIIKRASLLFDKLIVAVANSPSKNTFFTLDERIALTRDSIRFLDNCEVMGFSGLLTNFLQEHDVDVLVRGIRNSTDYNYEAQLFSMYKLYLPSLEIVFLQTEHELSFISSTLIREIIIHGGSIDNKLVPNAVCHLLETKFSNNSTNIGNK